MSEHIVPRHELSAEKLREALHYNPDTGAFTRRLGAGNQVRAGDVAGNRNVQGYLQLRLHGTVHLAHRLAWLYVYGEWPKYTIDHINRNRSDNRIANLRDVSHKQNHQNVSKRHDNKSGHTGVSWLKRDSKWRAHITNNYNSINLGHFTTLEEAISARKAGELKYWGAHRAE